MNYLKITKMVHDSYILKIITKKRFLRYEIFTRCYFETNLNNAAKRYLFVISYHFFLIHLEKKVKNIKCKIKLHLNLSSVLFY